MLEFVGIKIQQIDIWRLFHQTNELAKIFSTQLYAPKGSYWYKNLNIFYEK